MDNYTPRLIVGLRPVGRGSIRSAHERPERIGGKDDWAKILGNAQGVCDHSEVLLPLDIRRRIGGAYPDGDDATGPVFTCGRSKGSGPNNKLEK